MLYLIATPIGNLSDITLRALNTLKACDYILCEDTRHSRQLLDHYQISKPLLSYHQFNEKSRELQILQDLQNGKEIGLISDAGTPGIADPGAAIVRSCREAGLDVVAIPGPCAAICALSCVGLNTEQFQFCGFLPKQKGPLTTLLQELLLYTGTTICYESPQRLLELLQQIDTLAPQRLLAVARELTKKFEEVRRGTAAELILFWQERPVKGEIVLMISGERKEITEKWKAIPPLELVAYLENTYQIEKNHAIKLAAQLQGLPKRLLYNAIHDEK